MDLATMREQVRDAIKDQDSNDYYFSNDEVDASIQRVLCDYTSVFPSVTSLAQDGNDSDSRFAFTPPTDYLYALAVEHPVDANPPRWRKFYEESRGSVVVYGDTPAAGTGNVRIWYARAHMLTGTWSICPEDESLVVLGAAGYLATAAARHATSRLNVSPTAASDLKQLGKDLLAEFDRRLNPLRGRAIGPKWWPCWS
jgi:hypothetical protein